MNCIDVLRSIIVDLGLEVAQFCLIEHTVGVNWRVQHPTVSQKLGHLGEGLVQQVPLSEWRLSGKMILHGSFCPSLLVASPGRVVSISSRIRYKRKDRHLALMNFHLEEGVGYDAMKTVLAEVLQGMSGYLLETGRYYHFYGTTLLEKQEWIRFMSQFLMPTLIVSPRYIGHSLYRGYAALRLTVDAEYKPMMPTVCDFMGTRPPNLSLEPTGPIGA